MATDEQIEKEIQEKGLTAPRVTPLDIEMVIREEHYFTAADGVIGHGALNGYGVRKVTQPLHLLTFCVLILRNGFTVVGHSACASPDNFDAEVGRKVSRQKAIEQIWPLLGYELRTKLAQASDGQEA